MGSVPASITPRAAARKRSANREHIVYTFLDRWGAPLYVGQTGDFPARLRYHAARPWFDEVAQIKLERVRDRRDAQALEKQLLRELQPKHNIQGTEVAAEIARHQAALRALRD